MSEISESIDRLAEQLGELRKLSRRLERVEFERSRLQQALGLLSSYVKQAMEGMVLLDLQGKVLLANEAYASAHGHASADLIGKHQSVFHNDDQFDALEEIALQVATQGEFKGEVWHARKDGSVFPAFIHKRSVEDDDGNPVGYIESMRDVSELKHAEEAVRESEERFKAQFRGLPIPVYTWQKADDDFILIDFNRAAEIITKGEIRELKGSKADELYRDDPTIREQMWECYEKRESSSREMLYQLRTTGETRHLIVSYGYVPPDIVLVHTQDVTERVRAEQALRVSEEKYRELVENINDVICTFDAKGTITYVSPAVESLLGFEPADLIGRSFAEFVPAEAESQITESFQRVLTGEPGPGEYRLRAKSGEDRWIRTSSHPIVEDGRVVGLHSVLGDITESKRAENAIRESEEKFRMLAERSPNMIFINKMGRIVYVNPRSEEIMGYSREEFYQEGFDFQTLVAPDFHELTRESFARHRKSEEVEPYEYVLMTKSGRRLDAIITTKLIDYGGDRAILGIVTDITDRKDAERAVLESETRYRAIAELCSDSMYEMCVDSDGGLTLEWASAEDSRISGFPSNRTVSAAEWKGMFHPDDLSAVTAHFETLLAGQSDTAEFRIKAKTGEMRWIRNGGHPVWDEGEGRVSKIHGVVRDISAEVELVASLQESEQWYQQVIKQSPDAIVTVQNGCIVFANAACAMLLGVESPEMLIGRPILDFISSEDHARAERQSASREADAGSRPFSPANCVRIDGAYVPIELAASRISHHEEPAIQLYIHVAGEPSGTLVD